MKFVALFMTFLSFIGCNVGQNSDEYETKQMQYQSAIAQNYDYYVFSTLDSGVGKLILTIGSIETQLSLSVYFQDNSSTKHVIVLQTKNKNHKYYTKDQYGIYYQIPLEYGKKYQVLLTSLSHESAYQEISLPFYQDYEQFLTMGNPLAGQRGHAFPQDTVVSWVDTLPKQVIESVFGLTVFIWMVSLFCLIITLFIWRHYQKMKNQRAAAPSALEQLLKLDEEAFRGHIAAFPTDTVYGVGALLDDKKAIARIYDLKDRDKDKPLAILAGKMEDILPYIKTPTPVVIEMMKKYWPGALTIIFEKNADVPDWIVPGTNTIGFRIPNSPTALAILNHFGPMAVTSVNKSGEQPIHSSEEITKYFGNRIECIIGGNEALSQVSSTVVDATKEPFRILRQGTIKMDV